MQIIFTDKINRKLFFQRNYSVAWNLPIEEKNRLWYSLFASQATWLNLNGEK